MTAEVTTVVGQLSIQAGNWRSDAPNQVAVREPGSADVPGAGKGDLFVLAEVHGEISDRQAVEQRLAEAIRDAYYLARGSITASLRRAFQAAGEQLYRRNYQVPVDQRIVAGVVAVVMNRDDAFVVRTGSAAFFAVLGDHIQRYPVKSVWLDEAFPPDPIRGAEEGSDREDPGLGVSSLVHPHVHHFRVEPGDMLVLADSRLAGQLPLEDVVKAVSTNNVKTAIKNLGKVAQARDCSAMALAVIEEPQAAVGSLKVAAPAKLAGLLSRSGDQHAAVPAAEQVEKPAVEGQPVLEPAPAQARAVPTSEPAGKSIPLQSLRKHTPAGDSGQTEPEPDSHPYASPMEPYHSPEKVMASMAKEPTFSTEAQRRKPMVRPDSGGTVFHRLAAAPLLLLTLLVGGLKSILGLVLPEKDDEVRPQAGMQAYRPQSSQVPWAVLRNIAIAIPLLIAIIVGISYLQKERLRETEYAEYLENAQNKFQQAQAVEPAMAQGLLTESEALLVKAEAIKSDQPEITELRSQMADESDRIGQVQRLYYLPQLRQYTDTGTDLNTIVVQGVEVYVLDSGTDRIFHHRLDDTGETLLPDNSEEVLLVSRGQTVEESAVGDLLDMVWMPVGGNRQTSDLLVMNSTGLLEYNPNWGLTTAAVAGRESLVFPAAISSFFGNLYVLDPQANRLWRYLPTADGYNAPPESYFSEDQPVNLNGAIDLDIDGAVYIMFQDGRIEKYMGGQPVEFNMTGLDKPFKNPVSIFTAPDEEVQHIYVADAGNQRIVQLNKDGSFVRQFKPRHGETVAFDNLQDIFVDEISGRLYVLDSNNLYVGNIPSQ